MAEGFAYISALALLRVLTAKNAALQTRIEKMVMTMFFI